MSRSLIRSTFLGVTLLAGAAISHAQDINFNGGWNICDNPLSTSPDYAVAHLDDVTNPNNPPLFGTALGESGTGQFTCFLATPWAVTVRGRYGFMVGKTGSIQTTRDDWMMLTYGMPDWPANTFCYTTIDVGGARSFFGSGPLWNLFFVGASDRYMRAEETQASGCTVTLNIDLLGDAARYQFDVVNLTGAQADIGMSQGAWAFLRDNNGNTKGGLSSDLFISLPNQRTPRLETIWTRKLNPAVFPPSINIDWSQSEPFGLRIETGPSDSTTDPVTHESDATQADILFLGFHGDIVTPPGLIGAMDESSSNAAGNVFPIVHNPVVGIQQSDLDYTSNPAYLLRWDAKPVAVGQTRTFVQYFRSTWGQSNYAPPYTVVIDAPKLFSFDAVGLNQLTPNPATIRVWVDNIRGFTTAEQEVALQNVRITLDLTTTNGITLVGGGKTQTKTISQISSRRAGFVDFQVQADGISTGIQKFVVRVVAPPGPTKTLTGVTDISTTPKVPVVIGSNLITLPWTFSDSSLDTILGLSQPSQYQAFRWDPSQQGYVLATSSQRGIGTWLVINDSSTVPLGYVPLSSNPTLPTDMATGSLAIQLQQGWNLIGNPYPYPIPLGDLLGVTAGANSQTLKWSDLVNGFVSPSMAYWDTTSTPPGYKFISGNDAYMQPNTGYWLFVFDLSLTLQFPPVFYEGALVGESSGFAAATKSRASTFKQTDSQYRLMISARTRDEIDDQNFVGRATTSKDATALKIFEPPMGPKQNLGVSIGSDKPGETRLAQSLLATTGVMKWSVFVKSNKADQITLTWPNMSSVPKNVSFRLTDVATGTSRDMRRTSGYTFTTTDASTREFTIQAQPGTASKAIIGNVVVSQPGKARDKSAPFTISYTLSADATTTVRILGAGGKEVFTATRGRADSVGENTATWALRDNANRAVAPGVYRVEIMAETSDGQRVRKIVPINVIR